VAGEVDAKPATAERAEGRRGSRPGSQVAERPALRVVFFGPPGSGKGTQAALLAARLGVPAVSTGEMLRAAEKSGSPLGLQVRSTLAAGRLVDDATMAGLVGDRLSLPDARRGFLLDGYPRTLAQADTLAEILRLQGETLDAVIFLEVPEEELVRRMTGRGRADDSEATVRERLRVYREQTAPLMGYYRDRGLLRRVDGHRAVPEVAEAILAALRSAV
jgi:adenylate kinase